MGLCSYCSAPPSAAELLPANRGIFAKDTVCLDLALMASSEATRVPVGSQREKRQGEEYGGTGLRTLQCLVNRQPIHHIKYPAVIYYLSSENE